MKKFFYNLLIGLAGSDKDILERCPRTEHIKHAGFGTLVIIPAILGLYSMTYAISTFVDSVFIYTAAGLTWGFIVLCFDRFVVSTYRKKETVFKDLKSLTFLSRLVFAAFVGIAVAHPLVLLYFNESISVEMKNYNTGQIDSIRSDYKTRIDAYQYRIDNSNSRIKPLADSIYVWEMMVHDEVKGTSRGDNRTSGNRGYGITFRYDTAYLNRLYAELNNQKLIMARRNTEDSLAIKRLEKERDDKINSKSFSTDYLEREKALSRLQKGNPIIEITTGFLIAFFVFVDILPVTWKALTAKGPYDDYLNEIESTVRQETQTKIIEADRDTKIRRNDAETEVKTNANDNEARYNANVEFNQGEGKSIFKRSVYLKQSFKADGEAYTATFESERKFAQRILREEKDFKKFYGQRLAEILAMEDGVQKDNSMKWLEEIERSYQEALELIFEEHTKAKHNEASL